MSNFVQGAQHGRMERGSRPRNRPRDHSGRGDTRTPDDSQLPRVLPSIIEGINDRLDTLERLTRLHAQTIAHQNETVVEIQTGLVATDNDVVAYKAHVTSMHQTIDKFCVEKFGGVNERLELLSAQLESAFSVLAPR